ncbi:hypothetical protein Sjap_009206 [Stephania japonica]|uniref:Peptidase A1 domain-containing protein n=1 Tax=Stephania japonica TaxID=461633 RepID=A0AAP0JR23_9MAGN
MAVRVVVMLISLYISLFVISGVVGRGGDGVGSGGSGIFKVQHKFGRQKRSLSAIKEHDSVRHGRNLAGIDLPLGGNGSPTDTGLYYTKIGLGSPSSDYYVHIDTGSDIFWVNCVECTNCPKKSDLGIKLQLFNPHTSPTAKMIGCDQDFCEAITEGPVPNCVAGARCQYTLSYGDGSANAGYFVQDLVKYDQVTGNLQTKSTNASVIFGCGISPSGNLAESQMATSGILGFGQSSTSMISQLASAKLVRKVFAHCLDSKNGGGIFAIGDVAQPRVKTTPLLPNQTHYNVNLETIKVGKDNITTDVKEKKTIVDSGTTLAYLPKNLYDPLISKILAGHSDLQVRTQERQYLCFQYQGSNVDNDFPAVTFQFENSLSLVVFPHEYLFEVQEYGRCIGWQNSDTLSKGTNDMIILGDLVISNKLVVYDLENQTLGWTDYNCSSSIMLRDDKSGSLFQVAAKDISSDATLFTERAATLALIIFMFLTLIL